MTRTRLLTATLACLTIGGIAFAQSSDFKRQVGARQALMQSYAFQIGTLGAMAKGQVPYDSAAAQTAADNLVLLSRVNSAAMWPAGSDSDSHAGTRALPALWQNFPDVAAKGMALAKAAEGMAAVAGSDLDALRGAIGPLGGACGACHKAYRAE